MAIQRIPSFWDYLGQSAESFTNARVAKKGRDIEERDKRVKNVTELFNSGGIDSQTFSQEMAKLGMPVAGVQPNQPELKRRYTEPSTFELPSMFPGSMSGPTKVVIPPVKPTEDQRIVAGLPSGIDQQTRQIGLDMKGRESAAQAGAIKRVETDESDKIFKRDADRFVKGVLGSSFGKITPQMKDQAVTQAFEAYKKMRAESNVGGIPDEARARSFFDEAFHDMLIEQRKLENDSRRAAGTYTAEDRDFDTITRGLENIRKSMDDMKANNKMLQFWLDSGKDESKPEVRTYRRLQADEKRFKKAQIDVAPARARASLAAPDAAPEPPPVAVTPAPVDDKSFASKVSGVISKVSSAKSHEQAVQWINEAVGKTITSDVAKEAIKQLEKNKKAIASKSGV